MAKKAKRVSPENNKTYHHEGFLSKLEYIELKKKSKKNNVWVNKKYFLLKLELIENYLSQSSKNIKEEETKHICPICNAKMDTKTFKIKNILWKSELAHLVEKHDFVPSKSFIDMVFSFKLPIKKHTSIKIKPDKILVKHGLRFIKLESNQLNILDALMEHGGGKEKYKLGSFEIYSEHAGLLDFDKDYLEKVIVFTNTNVTDKYDTEIYLPENNEDAFDYEYIFHTHPPTPYPGSRAKEGFLYEFPSTSDLMHFSEHYNIGITQGSIVIAPEGMYLMRKKVLDGKQIRYNDDEFYDSVTREIIRVNNDAIKQYGTKFNLDKFFHKIAQDMTYINRLNKFIARYGLEIDYFPRKKRNGNWILEDIYIPVYPVSS